jgi:hypothetical protein
MLNITVAMNRYNEMLSDRTQAGLGNGRAFQAAICRCVLGMVAVLIAGPANGQGLTRPSSTDPPPSVGAVGLPPPVQRSILGERAGQVRRHLDATGKACVSVGGFSRQHTTNPKIFDHVITATNNCSQIIKMQVCYYKSQSCVAVNLPSYGRKEAVLGVFPSQREFRYEYREQF